MQEKQRKPWQRLRWKKSTGGSAYWANTEVCLSTFLCMHKILVHAQHSCACTTLLCLHNTLVQKSARGPARGRRFFWVLALGPGPSSACTRVLCMHKNVVHAQECCACTRIVCMHKNLDQQDVPRRITTMIKKVSINKKTDKIWPPKPPRPSSILKANSR